MIHLVAERRALGDRSSGPQQGAVLEVTFTGTTMTGTKFTPVHIYDNYQPRIAEGAEAAQILERIETASAVLLPPP